MSAPSIRRALLIRCGLAVGALLCLLSAGVYQLVRAGLYCELDDSLFQTASLLSNQVELENGHIVHEWQEGLGANSAIGEDGLFQFWDEKSGVTTRSPALGSLDLPEFSGSRGAPLVKSIQLPDGSRGRAVGLRIFPFVLPEEMERMMEQGAVIDPKSLPHLLVVARDIGSIEHTLGRLGWTLGIGTLLTLALVFAVIRRVVTVTLRPIDQLAQEIQNRAEHRLDSALVVPGKLPVELASLAENFDSLLARVAAQREREKDFIRHAAHELRTPIAGLRATTDLALSQPRDAAAYAAHLTTCQKTAIELGDLVKRLSALARVGKETAAARVPLDAAAILRECFHPFSARFESAGLSVKSDLPEHPLVAMADPTLLRIVFNNLLDNAVSYAAAGSEIRLRAGRAGERVEIGIANRADPPPENPERLFEPLFRQAEAANPESPHLGIGLTLSLEAVVAMGGNLQGNVAGGEVEFVLQLPPG